VGNARGTHHGPQIPDARRSHSTGAAIGLTTGNPGYAIAASNAVLSAVTFASKESPKDPNLKKES